LSACDIAAIEPRLVCEALEANGGSLALPGFVDSHAISMPTLHGFIGCAMIATKRNATDDLRHAFSECAI
jgi:hypothetical protein